jgi:hypothetical protein
MIGARSFEAAEYPDRERLEQIRQARGRALS